jgi:hypothetical protein
MADATDILAAVATVLTALYPKIPVRVTKRRTAGGKNMEAGWQSGYPVPCLVVSCEEPEEIDRVPSFLSVSVGYPVTVEYVKAVRQGIANAPNSGSTVVVEDPDVRATRQALRRALYVPKLAGAPAVWDVRHKSRPAYEKAGDGGAVLLCSGEQFTYTVTEARNKG